MEPMTDLATFWRLVARWQEVTKHSDATLSNVATGTARTLKSIRTSRATVGMFYKFLTFLQHTSPEEYLSTYKTEFSRCRSRKMTKTSSS